MELRRLAAERRDADRVLEQAAGVGVVAVRRRRERRRSRVGEHGAHRRGEPRMRDLRRRGTRGTPRSSSASRRSAGVRLAGSTSARLERAHVELEAVAEPLDAAEHAHGVALAEAAVEQLDVVPDARVDAPARVDELEREVRRAALRPQPALGLDGEDALDDAVLRELGDHAGESTVASGSCPTISPFRALRYDEAVAGPLADLVAPPYDVIDEPARAGYLAASPYNIVHLTLPESEEAAGRDARRLARARRDAATRSRRSGGSPRSSRAPTASTARARASPASIEATPYAERKVLPHELTHAGPKEGRLRLLRATRTQLEPIFLLYDADPIAERPDREPDMDVDEGGVRTQVWRLPADGDRARRAAPDRRRPPPLRDGRRVPRGGPGARRTRSPCSSRPRSPGVEIFPTHRVARAIDAEPEGFMTSSWDQSSLALYREGNFFRVETDGDELDMQAVERFEPEGVTLHAVRRRGDRRGRRGRGRLGVPRARADDRAGRRVRRARRDDAAEVDVLLPQAHLRPPAVSRLSLDRTGSSCAGPRSRT